MQIERDCECFRCIVERLEKQAGFPMVPNRMVACEQCGNKRCPHSTDHRHACTGSNEPGQAGSRYA